MAVTFSNWMPWGLRWPSSRTLCRCRDTASSGACPRMGRRESGRSCLSFSEKVGGGGGATDCQVPAPRRGWLFAAPLRRCCSWGLVRLVETFHAVESLRGVGRHMGRDGRVAYHQACTVAKEFCGAKAPPSCSMRLSSGRHTPSVAKTVAESKTPEKASCT